MPNLQGTFKAQIQSWEERVGCGGGGGFGQDYFVVIKNDSGTQHFFVSRRFSRRTDDDSDICPIVIPRENGVIARPFLLLSACFNVSRCLKMCWVLVVGVG